MGRILISAGCFNPRPRRGGDDLAKNLEFLCLLFQSAPPQGGRRGYQYTRAARLAVSIRAPAGGATQWSPGSLSRTTSFNPRPRRGGDEIVIDTGDAGFLFQSAPPQGGRRLGHGSDLQTIQVSIRAPAGGATFGRPSPAYDDLVSIRAPAGGATILAIFSLLICCGFNPRPRRGGDRQQTRQPG